MADTFASRFAMVASGPGPLAWGLDPSGALLEARGLGDSPGGLDRFADIVLDAAAGTVGLAAMDAFVSRAHQAGSCLLVVTRSSNQEGRPVQSALGDDGRRVEEGLLREIGSLNRRLAPGEIGPVGAVVGPVHLEPELDLASARALFLAPGVGAQGATPEDVARVFAACPDRVMPSASRSLLAAGPDPGALRDSAAAMAAEFRRLLPASRPSPDPGS